MEQFVSVGCLKQLIFELRLGKGTDFDLEVSNAHNSEAYVDESTLIPRNTSVLVRRIPRQLRKSIVLIDDKLSAKKVEDIPAPSSRPITSSSSAVKNPMESEWDDFGDDVYAIPEEKTVQSKDIVSGISEAHKDEEDRKIKALIQTPALSCDQQTQRAYGPKCGSYRVVARHGGGLEHKTPLEGYVCHRCKVPGHFIQHCPTNGDPSYDIKRVRLPKGIPKSMLAATRDSSNALPSGDVAVLEPDETAFENEVKCLPSTSTSSMGDIPPELRCPLCKKVMKDAMFTSKCCFSSFCDKCIKDYITSKSMCTCGAANVLADDLLPNRTLRETISRMLQSTSTSEKAGTGSSVQESSYRLQKVPSPSASASSKNSNKKDRIEENKTMKRSQGALALEAVNVPTNSLDKTITHNADESEAAPELVCLKESMVTAKRRAQVPAEEKKKKIRLTAAPDMQWSMPLGSLPYDPYSCGGMPWGLNGCIAPFYGTMPLAGMRLPQWG